MCASLAICVDGLVDCAQTDSVFSALCVDDGRPLTTGKAFNTIKIVDFFLQQMQPPRDHFLFGNPLRNLRAVYCLSSESKLTVTES